MQENKVCQNCGKEFLAGPGEAFCMPCEMAIQAVEPPQYLRDLRSVYDGTAQGTPGQLVLSNLLAKNPKEFLAQLKQSEKEWRQKVEKANPGTTADVRKVKVEALIDRILEDIKKEKP